MAFGANTLRLLTARHGPAISRVMFRGVIFRPPKSFGQKPDLDVEITAQPCIAPIARRVADLRGGRYPRQGGFA